LNYEMLQSICIQCFRDSKFMEKCRVGDFLFYIERN